MVSVGESFTTPDGHELERFTAKTTAGCLHCEASGDPGWPLVLLLHGSHLSASARDWRVQVSALGKAGLRAVSVSFPGCGELPHRSEGDKLPARPDTVLLPGGAVAAVLDLIAILSEEQSRLQTLDLSKNTPNHTPLVGLVGEGWGASVALAVAQWEPGIVVALSLFHPVVSFGRFPFEGKELKALDLPVEVIWGEAGSKRGGRAWPLPKQLAALCSVIADSGLVPIHTTRIWPPLEGLKPDSRAVLAVLGWPSEEVFGAARGRLKYASLGTQVVGFEKAAAKAPTKSEASELRERGKFFRQEIDFKIHQDNLHASVAARMQHFFYECLVASDKSEDKEALKESDKNGTRKNGEGDDHDDAKSSVSVLPPIGAPVAAEISLLTADEEPGIGEGGHEEESDLSDDENSSEEEVETETGDDNEESGGVDASADEFSLKETIYSASQSLRLRRKRSLMVNSVRDTPETSPFFRHGLGLKYKARSGTGSSKDDQGCEPSPCAASVDASGLGVHSDKPWSLEVGQRVQAGKSVRSTSGASEVSREHEQKLKKGTGRSQAFLSRKAATPFSWSGPSELTEVHSRRQLELSSGAPLPGSCLVPGTVVGVGTGGLADTYSVEYDDGSLEACVHRLRIVGPGDPLADSRLVPRPPSAFDTKVVATRLFRDGTRNRVAVRTVGSSSAPPLLVLHGGDSSAWSRDMRSFFEPLVSLGYRVLCPDLPGFGESAGPRWPAANEGRHGESGGPIEVLEDVLKEFGWRPLASTDTGGSGGGSSSRNNRNTAHLALKAAAGAVPAGSLSSHSNARLDIVGFSTGAALALSFALKHGGNQQNSSHRSENTTAAAAAAAASSHHQRIGALVLINGVYRSGYNDASLLSEAAARMEPAPPTAQGELAKLAGNCGGPNKTLVLAVGPDPVHQRSLVADLAKKIPGAVFEEVGLPLVGRVSFPSDNPPQPRKGGRVEREGGEGGGDTPLSPSLHPTRVRTPGVDHRFLPPPSRTLSKPFDTAPALALLPNSSAALGSALVSRAEAAALLLPANKSASVPGAESSERDLSHQQSPPKSVSAMPALKEAARHCYEAHSGVVVPRVVDWLLRWGTPRVGGGGHPGSTTGESAQADNGDAFRGLSPLRTGLAR